MFSGDSPKYVADPLPTHKLFPNSMHMDSLFVLGEVSCQVKFTQFEVKAAKTTESTASEEAFPAVLLLFPWPLVLMKKHEKTFWNRIPCENYVLSSRI